MIKEVDLDIRTNDMVEIGPCVCTQGTLGRRHRERRSNDEEENSGECRERSTPQTRGRTFL